MSWLWRWTPPLEASEAAVGLVSTWEISSDLRRGADGRVTRNIIIIMGVRAGQIAASNVVQVPHLSCNTHFAAIRSKSMYFWSTATTHERRYACERMRIDLCQHSM